MAAKLGVKMRMPSVVPRTRLAHEAAAWARSKGQADIMHDAIFRAFFERSEDIGRTEVLADLAAGIGLDSADLKNSLTLTPTFPKSLRMNRRPKIMVLPASLRLSGTVAA